MMIRFIENAETHYFIPEKYIEFLQDLWYNISKLKTEGILTMSSRNKYPMVFVHGMFGWGGDEGLN